MVDVNDPSRRVRQEGRGSMIYAWNSVESTAPQVKPVRVSTFFVLPVVVLWSVSVLLEPNSVQTLFKTHKIEIVLFCCLSVWLGPPLKEHIATPAYDTGKTR